MLRIPTALVLLAIAAPALADTRLSFVNDSGQPATQIYIKGGKVRMEGGRGIGIYDAATNTFTMLMPDKKQYLVFDEKSANAMGASANAAQQQAQAAMAAHQAQIDQANQQAQAAMANMTPEQKAMMQQMMAGHGGAPGAGPMGAMAGGGMQMDTKDLGTSETVAGHKCEDMQVTMNGRPVVSLCVMSGSPSALGIPAADVKTLEAMHAGMLKLSGHMGPMGQAMASMMVKGFSLKTTRQVYRDMQPVTETDTFKDTSTVSLSAALFEIPAGYTETTLPAMMQPGGHS